MTRVTRSPFTLLIIALFVIADVALVLFAAHFHAMTVDAPHEVVYFDLLHPVSDTVTGNVDGLTLDNGRVVPFREDQTLTVSRNTGFVFRGWAVDTQEAEPFLTMLINVDRGSSEAVPYGVSRPDVASALHCSLCRDSGYAIDFRPHELSPGKHVIRTRFVAPGASGTVFGPVLRLLVN